ncbi:MAG: insulinase family protein, partial [Anaeroplasmataceae bacterium]|nr:insulinase family protein [Anaeroplasmataceae bacterium]
MRNNSELEIIDGLRVCYIEKPLFHKSYAGIGVNFGGRDIELMSGDEKIKLKEGTAHFIEHKLFQLEDGDAFEKFSKMGVNSNAYTDLEKTIYYFTTSSDLYEPLALLLKMYFTPVFKEEDIEKEKEIILSEIKMYDDIPQTKFSLRLLKALYHKHPLSSPIAGTIKSVKEITKTTLDVAYKSFYTIENSVLVVASNEPRQKVYRFIKDTLSHLHPLHSFPKYISYPLHPLGKDFIYKAKVEQPTAALAIRFSANQNMPLFCNYIMGIFDSLFSPISPFFKKLYEKKAFLADIDYSVSTLRDTSYAILSTTSNHPKLFLE